jgi:hypothetical protein
VLYGCIRFDDFEEFLVISDEVGSIPICESSPMSVGGVEARSVMKVTKSSSTDKGAYSRVLDPLIGYFGLERCLKYAAIKRPWQGGYRGRFVSHTRPSQGILRLKIVRNLAEIV